MKYFIGLTFDDGDIHTTKIQNFRKRFDSKFKNLSQITIAIIPPFDIDFKNKEEKSDFNDQISELLDGNFFGIDEISQIEMNGINFIAGKKRVLSLTPQISTDIFYTQEQINSILKDYGVRFTKQDSSLLPLLVLGRLENEFELENAVNIAKVEFADAFTLNARSISLFEKGHGSWHESTSLFRFKKIGNLNE